MSEFEQNTSKMHETFDEALAAADCEISASELQGILTGMVSAGLKPVDPNWQSELLAVINDGHNFPDETLESIKNILLETHRAFLESEMLAPILIPADDYPLIDRLENIALWCQGYLLGFGLKLANTPIDSPEISEALQDISDISQLAMESDESEESQIALETLIEHIKVAVKVIYLELVFKQERVEVNPLDGNNTFH